ncbi:MAG TPA: hypothetical protein VFR23_13335 [Jiangellaceae bacterium]|nr:hypothetical protein [Jiangellaceae bacterium]
MANEQQTSRLRPSHIIASSLAALTGAFLASRLGVYGTVIGVGVISFFSGSPCRLAESHLVQRFRPIR